MNWLSALVLASGFVPLACAGRSSVEYSGAAFPATIAAVSVREFGNLPVGYERIGTASAKCDGVDWARPVKGADWLDVVCEEAALLTVLREQAAAVGGTALVGISCRQAGLASDALWAVCRAGVAAPLAKLASGRGAVAGPPAPRFDTAWATIVDVTPAVSLDGRNSNEPALVRECPVVAPPWVRLASVVTRCEACTRPSAESALRTVVAKMGGNCAGALQCMAQGTGWLCQAESLGTEATEMSDEAW